MALLQSLFSNLSKRGGLYKFSSAFMHNSSRVSSQIMEEIKENRDDKDLPVEMENPFKKEKPQCILCKYDIEPDFKNVRLLSQFVSTFTGRIYGRHITGLCLYKHTKLLREIRKAQAAGLMGVRTKDPNFLQDPDLYDPSKPFKVI